MPSVKNPQRFAEGSRFCAIKHRNADPCLRQAGLAALEMTVLCFAHVVISEEFTTDARLGDELDSDE